MNISSQTREYAQNLNAVFTSAPNNLYTKLPKYMTRLQNKIWANAKIILPESTSFRNIVELAKSIENEVPYIHRYSHNDHNTNHSLIINLNDNNSFTLTGYTIDLYRFITSQAGYNILSSLWDDNYSNDDENQLHKLSKDVFHKSIHKIYSLDNCPNECGICRQKYTHKKYVCKTKCKHFFHTLCLEKWCTMFNSKCPMCRTPVEQIN